MGLRRSEILVICSLVVLAVGLKLFGWWKLGYQFDWDQERDAQVVADVINQHKFTLIGPRVASENGFFVGPYHYYLLLPFFLVSGGHPESGMGLGVFVTALTVSIYYLVGKRLWNSTAGILAAVIYALSGQMVIWNAMYEPLFAIIGFYLIYRAMEGRIRWIWPVALAGLAVNFNVANGVLTILVLIGIVLAKKRPSLREVWQLVIAYLVWFLPLFIFDLRHNFLNVGKAVEFTTVGSSMLWDRANFFRVWWKSWMVFNLTGWDSDWRYLIDRLLAFLCLVAAWIWIGHDRRFKLLTVCWLFLPAVLLYKYRGNLPEYYFGVAAALLPLIFAALISKIKPLAYLVIILLLINQLYTGAVPSNRTLSDKLRIVDYLVAQRQDQYFNISYDMPLGLNNGFDYLFSWRGRVPDTSPRGHLYTIVDLPTKDKGAVVVSSGSFGLIRR